MNYEKMNKWMELAKQFHQGEFWDSVFDAKYTKQIMEQFIESPPEKRSNAAFPLADIFKSNHEFIIVLDLPGVRKEDIELSVTDYTLNVKGIANRGYAEMMSIQKERYSGEFERTISLPELSGSGGTISAKFNNGTVEIRIPRSHKPKEKIKIE